MECISRKSFFFRMKVCNANKTFKTFITCLKTIPWTQRIRFKLRVTAPRCQQGNAPQYLVDCCKSMTDVASRQRLRSTSRHQLIVPRHRRTKYGRRAFSVAGPTAWNSLPDHLRDPSLSEDTVRRSLETYLFALY